MKEKIIDFFEAIRFIFKKYNIFSVPFLLVIIFFVGLTIFNQVNNPFSNSIKKLKLPQIPSQIGEYMDTQSSDSYNSFDWYSYYSPELGRKVSVKYSGAVNWHHSPLLNRSINYKYNGETLRLKSFSSENVTGNSFDNPFLAVFSEYSNYNIAREFTKKVPRAEIVQIGNDKSNIMIQWKDDMPNVIRELDTVEFLKIIQAALYSKDRETFRRYFSEYWKDRENTVGSKLQESFMDLLYTPLYYADKEIKKNIDTDFNENDLYQFLAMASVFGSKHMEIHNLVYQANIKNDEIADWSPIVYDFMGDYTDEGRYLSPFTSYNYLYEFFLRSPQHYYNYLRELNNLNQEILGNKKISSFYDKFSCKYVSQYPEFQKILSLGTADGYAPFNNINGFCLAVDKIKNFESMRYLYLNEQLGNSTMRWNILQGNEGDSYLAIWNPSPIPVKIDDIRCGHSSCVDNWELVNRPSWNFDSELILPKLTRIEGGYNNAGIPTSVVPQPFVYTYQWKGKNPPDISNISFKASNAINGKEIFAVKSIYPMLEAKAVEDQMLPPYYHKLKINILNFENTSFVLNPDNLLQEGGEWKIEVKSSKCKPVSGEFPEYVFDCSVEDSSSWPHLLDYSVELSYKGAKIRELKGEFFQDYSPIAEGEKIDQESFEKYRIEMSQLTSRKEYKDILGRIGDSVNKEEFQKAVAKQESAYFIPQNSGLTVSGDLSFPKSVIFLESGSTIEMSPLAQLKTGVFIANGNDKEPVTMSNETNLPAWNGIVISQGGGGFIQYSSIVNTANIENGAINAEDSAFLMIANTKFEGNSSGLKCSNCVLDISGTSFTSNRWFRVDAWALDISNSSIVISDLSCSNLTNCIISSDNKMDISGIFAENIKSSVFKIEGASSVVNLKSITVKNAPSVIRQQYSPVISYANEDIKTENVNYPGIINLDDLGIYENIIKQDSEEFYQKYKSLLEKKYKNNPVFVLKKNPPVIKKDIIVPEGVTLEILKGTEVKLENKTSIISFGQIIANGKKDEKIRFSSGDRKGKSWGTILLRGEKAVGKFDNCIFENGGGDYLVGFEYTGSLTAHYAQELKVTNSSFENNTNDDALNCKYSFCLVAGNLFKKNAMDAVDFDFAKKESSVYKNIFQENGNDAIDLSSSDVKIYENQIIGSGDKGISVGEGSHPVVFNNLIKNNNIGIESKDASMAVVINNDFSENKTHLNAYQKKKRFAVGGEIEAFNNVFIGDKSQKSAADSYSKINISEEVDNTVYDSMLNFYDIKKIKYGTR